MHGSMLALATLVLVRACSLPGLAAHMPRFGPIILLLVLAPACSGLRAQRDTADRTTSDLELFEAVLRHMLADSIRPELRVDPRPLRDDPRLVSLHRVDVIPERWHPDAASAPLANASAELIDARIRVLTRLRIGHTDAIRDARCPGIMTLSPQDDSLKLAFCPRADHRSVIVGLARAGGPYWPGNIDERRKYGDTTAFSVRVIQRNVGPRGSVELSSDYVFIKIAGSQWQLSEWRPLLIVE